MKVLIRKHTVLGVDENGATKYGKPCETHDVSASAAFNICSVERGFDVSKADAKTIANLKEQIAQEQKEAAEALAKAEAAYGIRDPKVENREPVKAR